MTDLFHERQQLVAIEACWIDRGSPCAWAGCIHDFVNVNKYDFHKSYKCLTRDFNLLLALSNLLSRIEESTCVDVIISNRDFIDNTNIKMKHYYEGRSESLYPAQHNIISKIVEHFERLPIDFRPPQGTIEGELSHTLKVQAEHWQKERARDMGLDGGHY